MASDRHAPFVHRILFGYGASHEFGVQASSLPPAELQVWQRSLGWHVRVPHGQRPARGLWYWAARDEAAVVHRVADPGDWRADRSQVLVGSSRILTCRTALNLYGWPGWHDLSRHAPVHRTELATVGGNPTGTFRRGDLVALVRPLLARPDLPLSVVAAGCDQESRVALLRCLLDVLEDLFYVRAGRGVPWTFSTFEAQTGEAGGARATWLPRVAFLPASTAVAGRSTVRLPAAGHRSDDRYWLAANALVSRYLDDGYGNMMDWLDRSGILGTDSVQGRLQLLLAAAAGGRALARAGHPLQRQAPELRGHSDVELIELLDTAPRQLAELILAEVRRRRVAMGAHRPEVRRWLVAGTGDTRLSGGDLDALVRFAFDPAELRGDGPAAGQLARAIGGDATPPAVRDALRRFAARHAAPPAAGGAMGPGPGGRTGLRAAAASR
jgi:hypothetical protein